MPKSAGSTAVSSSASSRSSARSSSAASAGTWAAGGGLTHAGGLTRLLNKNYAGERYQHHQGLSSARAGQTHGAVHEEPKSDHLEERDREEDVLPTEAERHDPDGKRAARVDHGTCGGAEMPRHAQPEPVEQADGDGDGDASPEHARRAHDLAPPTREVEERRAVSEERQDGHKYDDGDEAEEALVADRDERRDAVAEHDLLFDDELDGRAAAALGGVHLEKTRRTRSGRRE